MPREDEITFEQGEEEEQEERLEESSDERLEDDEDEEPGSSDEEQPEDGDDAEEEEDDELPEKYRGKSARDVVEMHRNLESRFGQVQSERERDRQELLQLRARLELIEREKEAAPAIDEEKFRQRYEDDPAGALLEFHKSEREQSKKQQKIEAIKARQQEATAYYNERMTKDEEFKQLDPTMDAIIQRYGVVLNPEFAFSREAIDLLELAAKGATREAFAKSYMKKQERVQGHKRVSKKKAASATKKYVGSSERKRVSPDDVGSLSTEELMAIVNGG